MYCTVLYCTVLYLVSVEDGHTEERVQLTAQNRLQHWSLEAVKLIIERIPPGFLNPLTTKTREEVARLTMAMIGISAKQLSH